MIEFFHAKKRTLITIIFIIIFSSIYFYFYEREKASQNAMIPIVQKEEKGQGELEKKQKTQNESGGKEKKEEARIVVDVKGAVVHPGVYTLRAQARVYEVLSMAGGLLPQADDKQVNGAQLLQDGVLLYIPRKGEAMGEASNEHKNVSALTENISPAQPQVDVNHATSEQLQTIPGIGPGKAAAIIQYREEKGFFRTIEDMTQVTGIGAKTLEKIKPYIFAK